MLGCGSSSHASPTGGTGGDGDAAGSPADDAGSTSNHPDSGMPTSAAGSGGKAAAGSTGGKAGETAKAGSGGTKQPSGGTGAAGSGSTSTNLPSDGNQLSLCSSAQGDCNKGYACYSPSTAFSTGRGFCSKVCTMASDCDGLSSGDVKYMCPTGAGTHVCEIECTGTDDTKSCPADMTCQQTSAGGGGAAGQSMPAVYHCKYPLVESPIWGACSDGTHKCATDLTCTGLASTRGGYCSKACEMDSDCGDKPSSGTISPTCATITPARGMTKAVKLCVLSCLDAKDGCPDAWMCVAAPTIGGGRGMGMGGGGGMGGTGTAMPAYARCGR
jgi:hypothetical protein